MIVLEALQPWLVPAARRLVQIAQRLDPAARVTSTLRTRAEQTMLYRRYLAGQSQYPAAPPGRSMHEHGRALDLIARPDVLMRLGGMWQSAGGRWSPADSIHFEA